MKRRNFIHLLTTGFLSGYLFGQAIFSKPKSQELNIKPEWVIPDYKGGYFIPRQYYDEVLKFKNDPSYYQQKEYRFRI